ncbi:hypothetical protein NE236_40650 [Actinoallomurus purpureus]|uniref:hypothetical protein n=1 Tax=Actinoallomurus purpureus TaxID=478114 RepID=UPI0020939231|nr:hypothetical protein [Actinoallomurus purpureus]MCO6011279.1 hypothetical protein [Actinoallomurus purpureus]
MRTRTRLATTAGLTILGGTALSGVAHAETGGLGLGDLTTPVSKTVSGVVKTTDRTSRTVRKATSGTSRRSTGSGLHVNLPVGVSLSARRASASAGVNASVGGTHIEASLGLCAGCSAPRPAPGSPPAPAPGNPPGQPNPPGAQPPGAQPPGAQPPGSPPPVVQPPVAQPPVARPPLSAPAGRGELATVGGTGRPALPYTGGPLGALAFLGAIAVVTGAAAVIGARPKARLSA